MHPGFRRLQLGPVALAVLLVLSGCLAPVDPGDVLTSRDKVVASCILRLSVDLSGGGPADPPTDRLSWEAGV